MRNTMLEALIFDFDGLILDTETPEFVVLQEIYAEYNAELSIEKWGQIIGGRGASNFDPLTDLERLAGISIARDALKERWQSESHRRIERNLILPGVLELLAEAEQRGLKLAIASSSSH